MGVCVCRIREGTNQGSHGRGSLGDGHPRDPIPGGRWEPPRILTNHLMPSLEFSRHRVRPRGDGQVLGAGIQEIGRNG